MINIVKETSPHIRRKDNVTTMMLDVIIALLPTLIFGLVVYKLDLLFPLLISIVTMVGAEFIYVGLVNMIKFDGKKHTFVERFKHSYKNYTLANFLTPLISAMIFSLILPPGMALYHYFIGALVGIVIGKLVFGGLGSNIFNPAAVGMVFAKLCFGAPANISGNSYFPNYDVEVGGTALGNLTAKGGGYQTINNYSILDMFLGKMPGTMGEAFSITIIIGAIYLIIRRAADFRIMVSYLGTFIFMMLIAGLCMKTLPGFDAMNLGQFIGFEVFSGGLLFGAAFMLTDPVTSPTNRPGRILFGIIAAVCTVFIRLFGALPEGVGFSILIANMFVPVIEHYKWSNPRYTWKNILWMVGIVVVALVIMILGVIYGGGIKWAIPNN